MKRKMKHLLMRLLGAFILFGGTIQAQDYSISDVRRVTPRNYGEITKNDEVTGYYFFYQTDKLKKGQRAFEIRLIDANLEEIAKETIIQGKLTYMIDAAFNGSTLLFKFYDRKLKKVMYRTLSMDGQLSKAVYRAATKYEMRTLNMALQAGQEDFMNLSCPSSDGFIDVYGDKESTYAYKVAYIDNNGKVKWTYKPKATKGVYAATYMTSSNNQILLLESKAKSVMNAKDYTFSLKGIDMQGSENFHIPLTSKMYNLMPHNAFVQSNGSGFTLIGEHFDINKKMMKAESQGVFMRDISEEGLWEYETFLGWESDIKPTMSAEEYKNFSKFSVLFHDVVRTKEGNIIAIGEQYKKQVSAMGVLGAVAASSSSSTSSNVALMEIRLGDMVMLHINKDRELENVNIFDKKNRSIQLEQGAGVTNTHVLGKILKAYGYMDYEFNQFNADKSVNTTAFYDRQKEKGKLLRQTVIQLVNFVDEDNDFTLDKISFNTEANEMWITRGKPGFLTVIEYWKKEKKMTWRLEVVNY